MKSGEKENKIPTTLKGLNKKINELAYTQMSNIKLFESKKIRSQWDSEQEKWFFSIVDVIEILSDTDRPRKYWDDLKRKLKLEGSELSEKIGQLKMEAPDGKRGGIDRTDV